jgi:hypothetical protein
MAIHAQQNALSTSAEALFTAAQVRYATVQNPISVVLRNDDAAIIVYVGNSNVSSSNGFAIPAGGSLSFDITSPGDWRDIYAVADSGTPELHIFMHGPSIGS